jgi:hypothetical protein
MGKKSKPRFVLDLTRASHSFLERNPQFVGGAASATPKRERDPEHVPAEVHADARPYSRYRLFFTSYRHRRIDFENLYTKPFTDAFVAAGILADDSPDHLIEEPHHRQIQIPASEPERTEVLIEEIP